MLFCITALAMLAVGGANESAGGSAPSYDGPPVDKAPGTSLAPDTNLAGTPSSVDLAQAGNGEDIAIAHSPEANNAPKVNTDLDADGNGVPDVKEGEGVEVKK